MTGFMEINPRYSYAEGAIAIAERGAYFKEAEQIARAGLDLALSVVDDSEERRPDETLERFLRSKNYIPALMYDAYLLVSMYQLG
jgi:hypothetical protein